MTDSILLCTVGGSHQPILTAIGELDPAYVLFFCTGDDPATGKAGSRTQVEGKGTPVEVRRGDQIERLANIPTLAHLSPDQFELAEVPADDLDPAVRIMLAEIDKLRDRFPAALLVADYTGGTKTMTAALTIAALERERVELRLVTGARANLVKVHDGSQAGLAVGVEGIRMRRGMAPFLAAWDRYAYGEAALGLAGLAIPRDATLRAELQIARDLSRALDAWDRFDHAAALSLLDVYCSRIGKHIAPLLQSLRCLTEAAGAPRRTPARLWDLWLNAQRRAAQGRYDDAVARLYRLIEWTAQWLLSTKGIDTAHLQPEQIPAPMVIPAGRNGNRVAGLMDAWSLVGHHLDGVAAQFAHDQHERMRHHVLARNSSILAHGETPIDQAAWQDFAAWIDTALLPVLEAESALVGLAKRPQQLPNVPIW